MPQIDIVDSTWIGVPARRVAMLVADPANWRRWWPRLSLAVTQSRGSRGVRWLVSTGEDGTVTGSMEVWLEPVGQGTARGVIAHYFLRLDGAAGPLPARQAHRLTRRYRSGAKRLFWGIGDTLDPDRLGRVRVPSPRLLAPDPGRAQRVASAE